MDILSKQEVAEMMGVHIRAICYHIKKGNLNPIKVRGKKFILNENLYELPDRYDSHTKLIFLRSDILNFIKN